MTRLLPLPVPLPVPGETRPCRSVLIDPHPIEHLDEDWAIPCERYPRHMPPPCDHPAEWIAWSIRCCPDRQIAVPLCGAHKDELLTSDEGVCAHCRHIFAPTRTGFTLIEPLNRRTA